MGGFRRKQVQMIPYLIWRLVEPVYHHYITVYLQYTDTHTHIDVLTEIPIATLLPS